MAAINFDQPSKGQVSSTETALSVVNTGGGEAIRGTTNSDTNAAVVGMSQGRAHAGFFHSEGGVGGWFQSKTGEAIRGTTYSDDPNHHAILGVSEGRATAGWFQSKTGEAIRGTTYSDDPNHHAILGVSEGRATGGWFQSKTGIGVFAKGKAAGRFEGDVEVTGDITLTNADCAEEFDVYESTEIEPGTVMVLSNDGKLVQSNVAYDKKVAGVVSGGGSYKAAIVLDKKTSESKRVAIALLGKVYCKVDAQYSEIQVGDLLTTSSNPGYAMKAVDPLKAFGTIIGKALSPLGKGRGVIPILIALQ